MPITDTYHAYITLSVIIVGNTDKEMPKMLQKIFDNAYLYYLIRMESKIPYTMFLQMPALRNA